MTSRSRFVREVARVLDLAGVEYVFLHGYSDGTRDSDLDLAVTPGDRSVVDLLLRSGALGPLLQRFDYDVPWSRYYVVAAKEPGRRYRQVDVACDPWGIGKYGPAVRLALQHRRTVDGLTVPEPAAETLYLAVKRARKGASPEGAAPLVRAFKRDPRGATATLTMEFGIVGSDVASALESGTDIDVALAALLDSLDRRRRSPALAWRRAVREIRRVASRVGRPTGLVVSLVGPDGVGKSTLAAALEADSVGAFRASRRLHLGPGILPSPGRLLRRSRFAHESPHDRPPSGRLGSCARAAYFLADLIVGWPTRVWAPRIRSTLVVIERGPLDLGVDPRRYRLRKPPRLLGVVASLLTRVDLSIVLDGTPGAIHARKPELPVGEISRQLSEWRKVSAREPRRFRRVDTAKGCRDTSARALELIDGALAERQGRLDLAALALTCLGGPKAEGKRYSIISARGQVRWLAPQGVGPVRSGLYRAAGPRHRLVAEMIERAAQAGVGGRDLFVDPDSGLAPVLAASLDAGTVDLSAAVDRDPTRNRVLLSVLERDKVVAFAKVSRNRSEVEHEAAVLRRLAPIVDRLVVPEVVELIDWRGLSVLLTRPVPSPGWTNRETGVAEFSALCELADLSQRLASTLSEGNGNVAVHGDFCGWNSAQLADGRLALWDWEGARFGLPLEDFFHWRMQRLIHFGVGTPAEIVRSAKRPDAPVRDVCSRLGVDTSVAPAALGAVLQRGLLRAVGADGKGVYELAQTLLKMP